AQGRACPPRCGDQGRTPPKSAGPGKNRMGRLRRLCRARAVGLFLLRRRLAALGRGFLLRGHFGLALALDVLSLCMLVSLDVLDLATFVADSVKFLAAGTAMRCAGHLNSPSTADRVELTLMGSGHNN